MSRFQSPPCVCVNLVAKWRDTHLYFVFVFFFFFFFFLIKWKADMCAVFILFLGSECTAHVTWSNTVKGSHFLPSWFLSSGFRDPQSWPPYYCVPASLCWRFIFFFTSLFMSSVGEGRRFEVDIFQKFSFRQMSHHKHTQKTHKKWFLFQKSLDFLFIFRIEIETTILCMSCTNFSFFFFFFF